MYTKHICGVDVHSGKTPIHNRLMKSPARYKLSSSSSTAKLEAWLEAGSHANNPNRNVNFKSPVCNFNARIKVILY